MKTIKYAVAAIALSTLSFGALPQNRLARLQTRNLHKIGGRGDACRWRTTLDGTELNWLKSRRC